VETAKNIKQKKNEYTKLNNDNNSSALDSKFVTIDTSSTEKNNYYNYVESRKIISQSNKKQNFVLNNSTSYIGSRDNSREKSKGKTNKISDSKPKDNNKKEIPLYNFTLKINKNEVNSEIINTRKKVFSPNNLIKAENFVSKNVLKENGKNTNDNNNVNNNSNHNYFTFNSKLTEDSKRMKKILPYVLNIKENNYISNSKDKNLIKSRIRENSANSRTSYSCSKDKNENSECVKASIGKRIDSKEKRKNESSKQPYNKKNQIPLLKIGK
jgi:hypothetical protein